MTSTDLGLAFLLILLGFWIGGKFVIRQARAGKMVSDQGIGPVLTDATTAAEHVAKFSRVEQLTLMFAMMQTVTHSELQAIREKAREQPHSVFALFAQAPSEEDQMMFASEMPWQPPEPLYEPAPIIEQAPSITPAPKTLKKVRGILNSKKRSIDLT